MDAKESYPNETRNSRIMVTGFKAGKRRKGSY